MVDETSSTTSPNVPVQQGLSLLRSLPLVGGFVADGVTFESKTKYGKALYIASGVVLAGAVLWLLSFLLGFIWQALAIGALLVISGILRKSVWLERKLGEALEEVEI